MACLLGCAYAHSSGCMSAHVALPHCVMCIFARCWRSRRSRRPLLHCSSNLSPSQSAACHSIDRAAVQTGRMLFNGGKGEPGNITL